MLVDLAAPHAELFHTATGTAYADLAIDGHRETWLVRGPRFRAWLRRRYHEATGGRAERSSAQRQRWASCVH